MIDANEDLRTRVALLEKTGVTRDQLAERDDKLMDRLERMLVKHETRMEEALQHGLKVYGHETSDQLLKLRTRINDERDAKISEALTAFAAAPVAKPKGDFLVRWGLPVGVAAMVGGPGTLDLVLRLLSAFS